MASSAPLLQIEDLSVTYRTGDGDVPALRGVDLALHRGEIVGVTGLIGSGYDDVVRLCFGADRARAGTISLDGEAHALDRCVVRKVAIAVEVADGIVDAQREED